MKSSLEKEKELIQKIERAKKDLIKLKEKRKKELGEIVIQSGLGEYSDEELKSIFQKCVNELKNEYA